MLTVSRKAQARAQLSKDLAEIHQYADDLKTYTALRNHCADPAERQRYSDVIAIMQVVAVKLNKKLGDNDGRFTSMGE